MEKEEDFWLSPSSKPSVSACYLCKLDSKQRKILYYNVKEDTWTSVYQGEDSLNYNRFIKSWRRRDELKE